jgi:Ca2+-dependent lipid-binding protein
MEQVTQYLLHSSSIGYVAADFLQYLILTLGDSRQATSTIFKSLNPEWNQTIELPILGLQSSLIDAICWDKDRFGKDYMGEFECMLEEIFANNKAQQEVSKFGHQVRLHR